ncbi:MAG: ABC transporter permease [Thermoanaerobaculia bacterium]
MKKLVARIPGPRTQGLRRLIAYRTLVKYLVLKEIKVKSRGTILGVGWTLLNPLFTIIVYFIVFQYIFRVGIPNFLAFFLAGFLMWTFFSRAITAATMCVAINGSLLKQSVFPLEVLPIATVLYHLFHHAVALGLALPLLLAFWGGKLTLNLLWVGVVLAAFVCFTLAVAFSLATIGVFFRDTHDILEVGLPMLLWSTPIFYHVGMAPDFLRPILAANPLSSFLGAARTALLDGQIPSGAQIGLAAAWLAVMLVVGISAFARCRSRFAEEL